MQQVTLFAWRLCSASCPARVVLAAEEWSRAGRFVTEAHRWRFVCARAGLRKLLSRILEQAPKDLRLATRQWGKPFAVDYPEIAFNLAHSEDYALLAIGKVQEVGVDLETLRPLLDALKLGEMCLTPEELSWLQVKEPVEQPKAFLRLWTRKEAVLKAVGVGLSSPMRNLDVRPNRLQEPLLTFPSLALSLCDLAVWPNTVAAVAYPHGSCCGEVRYVDCASGCIDLNP